MRLEEAKWIQSAILRHVPYASQPGECFVLNLGSGPRKVSEARRLHIEKFTIQPLAMRGYKILHVDMMHGEGVDLVGDIFDKSFQSALAEIKPSVLIFCNVLEHIPDHLRILIPNILKTVLNPGGYLIVSVPNSYPYHADPIDTMFRPSPQELIRLFSGMDVVESSIVASSSYKEEFIEGGFARQVKKIFRLFFPFIRPRRWLSHVHRFFWFFKPYKITVALFRRHEVSESWF